jgi:hypothetical protein
MAMQGTTASSIGKRATRVAMLLLLACTASGCQRSSEPAKPAASGAATTGAATSDTPTPASTSGGTTGATAPSSSATAEQRARAIRDASAQWPKVEGQWRHGTADSSYVAYFDGGQLRYLEERAKGGGTRTNRYFFDGGALFFYDGEKVSSVPGGEGPGMLPPTVAVVAEFRGGETVRAVAREHYGEKKLDDATIAAVRAQGAALAGAAQDEWSARQR